MSVLTRTKPAADAAHPGRSGRPPLLSPPPRADLLPPEIGEGNKKRAARSGMRLLMVFVLVLALAATGGAFYLQFQAEGARARAEDEALALLTKSASYADTRATLNGIAEGEAAVQVGGAPDIDWASYLRQLQALLPADVTLTNVGITSAGITEMYAQSSVPLERQRIAELTFTAQTTVLPSIPSWINSLSGLPGFADATPQDLTNDAGVYSATIVMHINTQAYSGRFAPPVASDGANPDENSTDGEAQK